MHPVKAVRWFVGLSIIFTALSVNAQLPYDAQVRLCAESTGQAALQACESALNSQSADYTTADLSDLNLYMGIALGELDRGGEALKYFKTAAQLNPGNPKIYYNMGVAYDELGHKWKALNAYRKAVKLDPNYTLAWGNLGVDAFNTERYKESVDAFDSAILLDSSYFDSRPDQREMYVKAMEIKPDTVSMRREVSLRASPGLGYLVNVGDDLQVKKLIYILVDSGLDVQLWRRWFATASFLYTSTKWKNGMQGDTMNIYAPSFGIKYSTREDDFGKPKDTTWDRSRYWFSLALGPYITHLSGAANSTVFYTRTNKTSVGINGGAGFDYYFHPNVGAGFQFKLHYVNFDENYFIFALGPSLIGRF